MVTQATPQHGTRHLLPVRSVLFLSLLSFFFLIFPSFLPCRVEVSSCLIIRVMFHSLSTKIILLQPFFIYLHPIFRTKSVTVHHDITLTTRPRKRIQTDERIHPVPTILFEKCFHFCNSIARPPPMISLTNGPTNSFFLYRSMDASDERSGYGPTNGPSDGPTGRRTL